MAPRAAVASLAIAVVAAASAACARWSLPPPIASGACSGCNVLLVTIDTLRSDRVGAFGGAPGLTPNLDRLAEHALRFTHTYSSAPLTLPSHASIMTGVSPPTHGLRANGLFRLGPDIPTLAVLLKREDYRTGAFVGAFVLDARFGLNRGFDVYDDRYGEKHPGDAAEGAERRAEDVIRPATAWIASPPAASASSQAAHDARTDRRWFAWVHLYDPHEPYRAPEPYASRHQPYDAEVAYTDAMVGKLVGDLADAGQLQHTLVIVAADHGESLGEHGERTHGVFAYDETLRVPWLIAAASLISGRTFDAPTRLIDLAPTTLELIGVERPASFEGRSLLPAVNARDTSGPPAYFEAMDANLTRNWAPLTGIVSGGYKLIALPMPELYNLTADPRETTNLFTRESERARTLLALLRNATTDRAAPAATMTLNADSRRRLQALGYVASSAERGHRIYDEADDPKQLIGPSNDLNRATLAFNAGAPTDALTAVQAIIRQHPRFTTAYGTLASMQRDTGDLRGAIATLEKIVGRGIADQRVMVVLAGYLQEAGAMEKSIGLLQAVIASHPDDAEAYNSLGVAEMRLGRHDQARAAYGMVLRLDPTSAIAYENLGTDALMTGDFDSVVTNLTRALALDPRLYDALYNLGLALHSRGRRDEARPYLERFVNEAPPSRYGRDIVKLRALLAR